jgi:hypothetical protein
MNSNNPKLFLIIVGVFLLFEVGSWYNRSYLCGPKEKEVSQLIENLGDSLAIREIVFLTRSPKSEINLINDSITINDTTRLCELQRIIAESNKRFVNHPSTTWVVDAKIVFRNNDQITMTVEKVSNDSLDTMTYFGFPEYECPGLETYYSFELGTYLEQIISRKGL